MVNIVQIYRNLFIAGLSAAAISACAPSFRMAPDMTAMDSGYGYAQQGYGAATNAYGGAYESAGYGYGSESYGYASSGYAGGGYNMMQSAYGTGYGQGAQLRGPCQVEMQGCGMMRVVPVYPVYQIVTPAPPPAPAPVAQVVEVPRTYEPEPIPYVEPVYEPPVQHWPEPETPVPDWKPLRK